MKVDDFLDNLTLQCCVEDVESLSSNANCTIIIKEGEINESHQFDHRKCVLIKIPETLHLHKNHSYEAYIDGDPDVCYRIIYHGNETSFTLINIIIIIGTSGAMEQKGNLISFFNNNANII